MKSFNFGLPFHQPSEVREKDSNVCFASEQWDGDGDNVDGDMMMVMRMMMTMKSLAQPNEADIIIKVILWRRKLGVPSRW